MKNTINPKSLVPWKSNLVSPGDKFTRLTVISTHKIKDTYRYIAKVVCDCGSEARYTRIENLRKGTAKSCGCLQRESATTHGCWNHPIFPVWHSMMDRCYKKNNDHYYLYGGKGKTVCDRWHDPNNFIKDMYPTYKDGLQIERVDNDGNYSPENCKWATRAEQAKNRSNHRYITYKGETHIMAYWSKKYDIKQSTLDERIKRGWSVEKALTTPPIRY